MPPPDSLMADHIKDHESLESGASVAESVSCVSVAQASFTGAVSLSVVSTQKGDTPAKTSKRPLQVTEGATAAVPKNTASQEQEAIFDFLRSMPMIDEEFDIRSKIGEGTFSSVYLASLKGHPEEKFAVKHLVPTSSSSRIENEIHCLQIMGGCDHIMSLLTCVRHKDHIALIMPYFKHDRFIDYLHVITLPEARDYMRALFVALKTVHSHQIIHRDIKPSNFLYNRAAKQFQLVDFGLAHAVQKKAADKSKPRGRVSSKGEASSSTSIPSKSRGAINGIVAPSQTYSRQLHHRTATRAQRQSASGSRSKVTTTASKQTTSRNVSGKGGKGKQTSGSEIRLCPLRHKISEVCDICMARSNQAAPRAGTPGFRAPEVLLKSPSQTTAVDMWSTGVIFLCVLSGRYPFFRAHDDLSALTQIVSLLGSEECSRAANEYGKDLVCVPEVEPTDLRALCTVLRRSLRNPPPNNHDNTDHLTPPTKKSRLCNGNVTCEELPKTLPRKSPRKSTHSNQGKTGSEKSTQNTHCLDSSLANDSSWSEIPESAFDLLYRLLDFNPLTRITASDALDHSFLLDQR